MWERIYWVLSPEGQTVPEFLHANMLYSAKRKTRRLRSMEKTLYSGLTPPSMEVSFWIYWKTRQTSLSLLGQQSQTPKAPLRQGIFILFQLTNLIDTQYLWVVRDTKLAKRWQKRLCVSDPAMWAIYSVSSADFLMNSHADLQVEAEDSWSARRL